MNLELGKLYWLKEGRQIARVIQLPPFQSCQDRGRPAVLADIIDLLSGGIFASRSVLVENFQQEPSQTELSKVAEEIIRHLNEFFWP